MTCFLHFVEVVSVFKGRRKLNRNIRNRKGRQNFPRRGESSDAVEETYFLWQYHKKFSHNRWCCAIGTKLDTSLTRIAPIATPTLENSGMSLIEQGDTPRENQLSVQTWTFCCDSPYWWIPAGNTCLDREKRWEDFLWGRVWFAFRLWIRLRFTLWLWFLVGISYWSRHSSALPSQNNLPESRKGRCSE